MDRDDDDDKLSLVERAVSRLQETEAAETAAKETDDGVRDEAGAVYLRIEDYRTVELPDALDPESLSQVRQAFGGKTS